ncbi:MAG TPA: hypothetical protein DCR93_22020 [Cytophagales bacterium]|nr:hypothetical protein [Cytophagales bacterium]
MRTVVLIVFVLGSMPLLAAGPAAVASEAAPYAQGQVMDKTPPPAAPSPGGQDTKNPPPSSPVPHALGNNGGDEQDPPPPIAMRSGGDGSTPPPPPPSDAGGGSSAPPTNPPPMGNTAQGPNYLPYFVMAILGIGFGVLLGRRRKKG